MGDVELGRLLRLKAMIDASANESSPRAGLKASADAYWRLRREIFEMTRETELADEFGRLFPDQVIGPDVAEELAQATGSFAIPRAEAEGRRAQMYLRQLAGWIEGLIEEQLLETRIAADAEAKARHEGRRVGFTPPEP